MEQQDDANTAYMAGVGTKSGKWGFDYNYRDLELNSVYEEWADSDFHDGGTKVVKGINLKLNMPLKMVFHWVRLIFNLKQKTKLK